MEYKNKFMLGKIKEIEGNASMPQMADNRSIVILNNTSGKYESVEGNEAISKIYPKAKETYRMWWRSQTNFKLGEFKITQVQSTTELANLLVCDYNDEKETLIADAVDKTFNKYGTYCSQNKLNVHINKLKSEEAWQIVETALVEHLVKRGVNVVVYV